MVISNFQLSIKMSIKKIILLFLSFPISFCTAQITFHKTFEGRVYMGSSVKQTADGGYIIGGKSPGFGGGYLIKTDAYGDTLWTRIYNGSISTSTVLQTMEGGYVLFGISYTCGAGAADIVLLKTDSNGNPLWSKCYGDIYDNYSNNIQQTSDSGYIISGYTDTDTTGFGNSYLSLFLIKTDAAGDTLWTKTYIGDFYNCFAMQQTTDGGFILAGGTSNRAFLLKTDATGIPQWSKTYGGSVLDIALCVKQLADGGFIFSGKSDFGGLGDVYLVRTDGNGDLLWSKIIGDSTLQSGLSFVPTNNNGYLITGYTSGISPAYLHDIFLLHTDSIGNFLWAKKIINSSNDDISSCIQQTTDGGYVISGMTLFNTPQKINLIKIDSLGNAGCSFINTFANFSTPGTIVTNISAQAVPWNLIIGNPTWQIGSGGTVTTICSSVNVNENKKKEPAFNISPNPSNGIFSIHSSSIIEYSILEIFNLIGEKIYHSTIKQTKSSAINISTQPNGIYFLKLSSDKNIFTQKIIIE